MLGGIAELADADNISEISEGIEKFQQTLFRQERIEKGLDLYKAKYAPDRVADRFVEAAEVLCNCRTSAAAS
jgi:hypothetical protein